MKTRRNPWIGIGMGSLWLLTVGHGVASPAEDLTFFENKIRPLLVEHCYECHSTETEKSKGDLLLDSRNGWTTGGTLGPAILPGSPEKSLILEAVRYRNNHLQMPPKGKLPHEDIQNLEEWIRRGAPDPREGAAPPAKKEIDIEKGRQFWAFRPVINPPVPQVRQTSWPRSSIDTFVLAQLEAHGLAPAGDAQAEIWLRRASYDLTGLPPSPEQTHAFAEAWKQDPDRAILKEVDRLLSDDGFGEKWGRHWLDLARYADSNGSSFNVVLRSAWRYRNWVIRAFNQNLPIDQFIRMQIAGDLLPWSTQEERDDNLVASAYLMLGSKVLGLFDKDQLQMDVIDEQLELIGKGFLGMTLGCARCHDHKFDPIPTRDYYALAGILASTRTLNGRIKGPLEDESDLMIRGLGPNGDESLQAFLAENRHAWEKSEDKLHSLPDQIAQLERQLSLASEGSEETLKQLEKKRAELDRYQKLWDSFPPLPEWVLSPMDESAPQDTTVRLRGVPTAHGERVPRGFLQVASWPDQPQVNPTQSGRLELAQWVSSAENPLTARVFVNRVWQKLFGEGLVRSVDNFGVRGEAPTHPELLDHLAHRFVSNGWNLKELIRELVSSRTYRMKTRIEEGPTEPGTENRLLQRQNRRRLEPEEIRDTLLMLAGRLEPGTRGPVVDHLPLTEVNGDPEEKGVLINSMRSVYQPVIRNGVLDVFEIFDFPNPAMPTGRRADTSVAPQALYLLNSPFVQETTLALGRRAMDPSFGKTPVAILESLFQRILCRPPSAEEVQLLLPYFKNQFENDPMPSAHDRGKLAQALISSTLFQFLD